MAQEAYPIACYQQAGTVFTARPSGVVYGPYTVQTEVSDFVPLLNDLSASDYIEGDYLNNYVYCRMDVLSTPTAFDSVLVTLLCKRAAFPPVNCEVIVFEGDSVGALTARTISYSVLTTTSYAESSVLVTPAEAGAIVDWSKVWVRVGVPQNAELAGVLLSDLSPTGGGGGGGGGGDDPTVLVLLIDANPASVVGGNSATLRAIIDQPAGTGGLAVSLASDNAAASVPASLTILEGETQATATVTTVPVASDQDAILSGNATVGASELSDSAALEVEQPRVISVALSDDDVDGGTSVNATLTFNGTIPTGGIAVSTTEAFDDTAWWNPANPTAAAGGTTLVTPIATAESVRVKLARSVGCTLWVLSPTRVGQQDDADIAVTLTVRGDDRPEPDPSAATTYSIPRWADPLDFDDLTNGAVCPLSGYWFPARLLVESDGKMVGIPFAPDMEESEQRERYAEALAFARRVARGR